VLYVNHGRPHIGANGVSYPPGKMDEKLKSENTQKNSSFLRLCHILRAIRAGRCRERRYADHIFIQIYLTMHHFVVKFSKFSSPRQQGSTDPPTKILQTFLCELTIWLFVVLQFYSTHLTCFYSCTSCILSTSF